MGVLGEGGFGTVYRCEHRDLQRPAAVKVMRRELAGDGAEIERFLREARIVASLRHPHIVAVLDCGAEGDPWIAFELVEGRTLEERLRERPLAVAAALELGVQLASALELAHAQGVVHRDVKPANVLESRPGHWKLADFGVAHAESQRTLTAAGIILGTPAYLAPEYIQSGVVHPSLDLYALGAVLYEALTGVRGIEGESALELVHNAVRQIPKRASTHRPDLPPRLDALLERALRKHPAERFESAAALRLALEALREPGAPAAPVAQAPDRSRPRRPSATTTMPSRASAAPSSRRVAALAAAGVLALAVSLVTFQPPKPQPVPTTAVAPSAVPVADDLMNDIAPLFSELDRCGRLFRTDREIAGVGRTVVTNVAEVEPDLAAALNRIAAVLGHAEARGATLRHWCWGANAVYKGAESLRYFPVPPSPSSHIGQALHRLDQLQPPPACHPQAIGALMRTATACALLPSSRNERAAADACATAYQELSSAAGSWTQPGERAAYLVLLLWRQINHERRAGLDSPATLGVRNALLRRMVEVGAPLLAEPETRLAERAAGPAAVALTGKAAAVLLAEAAPPAAEQVTLRATLSRAKSLLDAMPGAERPDVYSELRQRNAR